MNPSITPGEILLEEYLTPMGISQNAMARAIGVAPCAINEIIHGRRSITPATAIARASRALDLNAKVSSTDPLLLFQARDLAVVSLLANA